MNTLIIIFCCIVCVFGPFFLYELAMWYEEKSYNKNTLRIEKVTVSDGREFFYIRHKTRFFWIGPYIWEYYQDIYDGNYCSHTGWSWFRCLGDRFISYDGAKEEYDELIKAGSNTKIIKTEII